MRKINTEDWHRNKTYEWFKKFSNSTYSMNVKMDVTNLLNHVKQNNESFFIDLLYIVLKGLNSIEEMRMRLVDGIPVIYDDINPAFTVMTETGTFENVRFNNCDNFENFYQIASDHIESTKKQMQIKKENYNPQNCYNEYYITCVPWVDFTQFTHPMPDDISSQCIPRICWGKYVEQNGKYELTLNITVSHIFVDGYPLATTFNKIQELLDNADEVLKKSNDISRKLKH